MRRHLLPTLVIALASIGCDGEPPVDVLLLVTVDTLRADHLGAYGSRRELTPHLDALARESEVFSAAYAPAPFTLPSVTGLLTGRYPEALGVVSNASAVPPSAPTLATELRRHGWRTAAVVSNLVLRRTAGLDLGFDLYDDDQPQREAVRKWPERVAASTTDAALRALDALLEQPGAKLFLWVHYVDPHGPYTPPDGLRDRYLQEEREAFDGGRRLPIGARATQGLGALPTYQVVDRRQDVAFYRAGYAGEVRYADREIGRLLDGLTARGLDERALIVFTADHGESLGENDFWFNHGDFLTEHLVRVPLLVRRPGVAPRRRHDVVSLVDLYPSLLAHLEGAAVDDSYPGRDLLARGADRSDSVPYLATLRGGRHTRFGIVRRDRKLVLSKQRDGSWDTQLFRRGEDDVDLSGILAQEAETLRGELVAVRERSGTVAEARQELSVEERAQLEALGYVLGEDPDVQAGDR
jgi:arylsulfatase